MNNQDQDRRILLAILLSLAVYYFWMGTITPVPVSEPTQTMDPAAATAVAPATTDEAVTTLSSETTGDIAPPVIQDIPE